MPEKPEVTYDLVSKAVQEKYESASREELRKLLREYRGEVNGLRRELERPEIADTIRRRKTILLQQREADLTLINYEISIR